MFVKNNIIANGIIKKKFEKIIHSIKNDIGKKKYSK